MKRKVLLLISIVFLFFFSKAQVVINNLVDPYNQDFNTLANVGNSNVLPTGWALLETGNNADGNYTASDGVANSGNTYSFGAANDPERAFGTILSGSLTPTIGVQFQNNSGATITSIKINYTGEQWRLGTADANTDRLDFQYSTDAVSLSAGTYIDVDALDFSSPVAAVVGAKDGNAPANRTVIPAFEIQGLNIPNGATFWLRWMDFNVASADDGLGIDDFTITFNGVNLPPCAEPVAQPTNLMLAPTPTTIGGSFDAANPAADQYLVVQSLSSPLGGSPVDGTNYNPGDPIGNGTVISVSSNTNFNATNLLPNTQYYFFVFALNSENCGGGPNYNTVNPLELSANTLPLPACVVPPNPPTNLNLNPGNNFISGSFTPAANANRYLVVRSQNNNLGFVPQNGVTYTPGQVIGADVIVNYSANANFNAAGLLPNTLYYFFVFSANGDCNGEPFYNVASLNGSASTQDGINNIPAGYYDPAAGLTCQPLKTALQTIVSANTQVLSYTPGLWNAYQYTDLHKADNNIDDIVWDMYSDNPNGPEPYSYAYKVTQCGNYAKEGDCYNREHSTPQSWFTSQSPMVSDIHHIFPTDGEVNNMRNNFPYGEVQNLIPVPPQQNNPSLNGSRLGTGVNFGYNGTVFEPIDEYKGDFARASLYMAVRYEDQIIGNNWYANGNANQVFLSLADQPDAAKRRLQIYDDWYIQTLIKWHLQDPVSAKEINRNNAIYYQDVDDNGVMKKQGNRNPFVDHPEYVAAIWACADVLPVTLIDFTASQKDHEVVLQWNVANQTNFKQFEVEKSSDGANFYSIGKVVANNAASYLFTDKNIGNANVIYYRLKFVDADNSFSHSKIVTVKISSNVMKAIVYPNPASDKLTVKLENGLLSGNEIQVADLTGRVVIRQKLVMGQKIIEFNVSRLSAGKYFLKIPGSDIDNQSFMIIR